MRPDIRPGERFPDYRLSDHTGVRRSLSQIQGTDPMILILSRGHFCPKDRQQHRLLVEMEPFVLEPGLVIHSMYNGYWYWGRPGPEDLRRDLRAVSEKIRSDWDPSKPGLREAWERGDKKSFWPYGKSWREVVQKSA